MNSLKKALLVILFSIIGGYLLLSLVYSIDTLYMQKNISKTINSFESEEIYHIKRIYNEEYLLDNFSDGIMISQAIFKSDDNPFIASLKNERFYFENSSSQNFISRYLNNENYQTVNYSRYWHGYLLLLKPFLLFLDIFKIRTLNLIIQSLLIIITLILITKKTHLKYALAFLTGIIMINPYIISLNMHFSNIYYIALFSNIFILLKVKNNTNYNNIFIYFTFIGIVTSFFDLLTTPIITYALPTIILLLIKREIKFNDFILTGIYWILGYMGMWMGKWILASIILHENILSMAIGVIQSRTSSVVTEGSISRIQAIINNYKIIITKFNIIILTVSLIILFYLNKMKLLINRKIIFYLLFLSISPIIWYFVTANHAYLHYYFTYRNIVITIFALLCIF